VKESEKNLRKQYVTKTNKFYNNHIHTNHIAIKQFISFSKLSRPHRTSNYIKFCYE